MPQYKVTAPDGRKLVLTGDSAPTEQELTEVFAQSPLQGVVADIAENQIPTMEQLKAAGIGAARGLTFDRAPNIAAAFSDESAEEIDQAQKEAMAKAPNAAMAGELLGIAVPGLGIAKGLQLGAKAAKLGRAGMVGRSIEEGGVVAQALAGGAEESLRKDGNTLAGVIGGGVGGKLADVAANTAGRASLKLASVLGSSKAKKIDRALNLKNTKDIAELAKKPENIDTLLQGVNSSDAMAEKIGSKASDALIDTAKRVENTIAKSSGLKSIRPLAEQAKTDYSKYLGLNKAKNMGIDEFNEISANPTIMSTLNAVKGSRRELRKLPDNSLPVLQATNSELKRKSRDMANPDTGLFKNAVSEMGGSMKSSFEDFGNLQKQYAKTAGVENLLDDLSTFKGREGRNFADTILHEDTKRTLEAALGGKKANDVYKALRQESDVHKRLSSLKSKSTALNEGRNTLESIQRGTGRLALTGLAGAGSFGFGGMDPKAGALLGGGALGASMLLGKRKAALATKLLGEGRKKLTTPTLRSILGGQAGRLTEEITPEGLK